VVRKTRRNTRQGWGGEGHRGRGGNSADFGELDAQFVGGAVQGVLDCALSGIQDAGHGSQSEAMVVLQFEDHAFPGRESSQSTKDASAQFTANQAALRAGAWAVSG